MFLIFEYWKFWLIFVEQTQVLFCFNPMLNDLNRYKCFFLLKVEDKGPDLRKKLEKNIIKPYINSSINYISTCCEWARRSRLWVR